jgi:hypothetical protein
MSSLYDGLSPEALRALRRAHDTPISYGVRAIVGPEPKSRLVILLGEAHLKLGPASAIGKEVVESIALRGIETFQSKAVFSGKILRWLIHMPRRLLRLASLGTVKDSTIIDAKQASHGYTVEIERTKSVPFSLHVGALYMTGLFTTLFGQILLGPLSVIFPFLAPVVAILTAIAGLFTLHLPFLLLALVARKHRWSWVIHPLVAILTARDTLMANGTVEMLKDYPNAGPALVIMGRAHLSGYEREMIERHGFRRIPFPPAA